MDMSVSTLSLVSFACHAVKSRLTLILIVSFSLFHLAVIAFHGSWNRDIPTGYKLVYVEMDADGNVASEPIDLLAHIPPNAQVE